MLSAIAWLVLLPAATVTTVFLIETLCGLLPFRRETSGGKAPSVTVVMPAHDEAACIAATIAMLRAEAPDARLLVVADNCNDDTAEIARGAQAEVIERTDRSRRGKAYALAFARDHLAADPPSVVIVIDADAIVERGSVARLANAADKWDAPVQANYLFRPRLDAGPMVQISGFALLLKNMVRQRGLAALHAPVELAGNGMAFPWRIFASAPLASSDLAEDVSLGIHLARIGDPPRLLSTATIWSTPASQRSTLGQRKRWERGFISLARREAPSLLVSGRAPLVWLGLHLMVPPLALLMAVNLVALVVLTGIAIEDGPAMPLLVHNLLLGLVALAILGVWIGPGREQIQVRGLLYVPIYMLWKLPIYGGALLGRRMSWNRTPRD